MSETPEIQVDFVKVAKDGTVERQHRFEPWPTGQDQAMGVPHVFAMELPRGDGEHKPVRHVTYDDPPGIGVTPEEYRELLSEKVREAGSLIRFVEALTQALVADNVISHGCDAEDAIPAVMEFAAKVYAEFSGTV